MELQHYRTRLPEYYAEDETTALAILDSLATTKAFLTVDEILERVKQQVQFDDRERLLELLRLMSQDHYLDKDTKSHRQFRFPLIKRWWQLDRGLSHE
ncbi:MAG: hypothetical protein ACFCD0_25630 [Gemmataceae bacterium]